MSTSPTEFASSERTPAPQIAEQTLHFTDHVRFREILDRVPDMVMVLNADRQIVYANRAVLRYFGATEVSGVAGKRPGELFHCRHSGERLTGCGTTRFCRFCGAVDAILRAQKGEFCVQECRLVVNPNGAEEALDLRVWASPVAVGGEQFTVFVVVNIADEKRRLWLEEIFLHDLMNTATALRGFLWLLNDESAAEASRECTHSISLLIERIIHEIQSHRQLVAAENNELQVQLSRTSSRRILEEVYAGYHNPDVLNGRKLSIDAGSESVSIDTDPTVLVRVLGNMVKNGLESSAAGEMVTIGSRRDGDDVIFWVHNPTYIPENIRLQIFNRSFSTKGRGRGLGTYSVKLLTERYLQGRVSFVSRESTGTTFVARLPLVAASL